ncbi:MAG: ArsB/NhaD family transporter [Victivallales bacterium]|nr:ArsB/NhaD family transporter [Victivallales bacterium]
MLFWYAMIVFFGTYILIASEKVHKTVAALLGAMLMLIVVLEGPVHENVGQSGHAPITEVIEHALDSLQQRSQLRAEVTRKFEQSERYTRLDMFARYANFDVVFTLAGMMILVNILSGTGLFQFIAIKCAKFARGSPTRTMVLLVLATAILSAFLDNVTTILLVAPVTLLVATELDVPPLPFLMAETIASNIGGTATLIGDPPNLIIGSIANLNFLSFIINLLPFIAILLVLYCFVLWHHYRRRMIVTVDKRARIMDLDERQAITDPVNLRRGCIVMAFTIGGFLIHGMMHIQPCVVAMSGATAGMLCCRVNVDHALEKIEWSTLFFFTGLFIVVNGADHAGVMAYFGSLLKFTHHWNPLLVILLVMWISGIGAAITNNVSYTAAMVTIIAAFLHQAPLFQGNLEIQHLMWWGLALSVCLGGNGTLVGAAANLVTAGIAGKAGIHISFRDYLRYGAPVTLGTMIVASLYIIGRYFLLCH